MASPYVSKESSSEEALTFRTRNFRICPASDGCMVAPPYWIIARGNDSIHWPPPSKDAAGDHGGKVIGNFFS